MQVKGADTDQHKSNAMNNFSANGIKCLISKPKIAGFGMNWQNCNHMVFVGLSDSWEAFYQSVRRCWRYGQDRPVHVHIVSSDIEGGTLANIKEKERKNNELKREIINIIKDKTIAELRNFNTSRTVAADTLKMEKPAWL